MGRQTSKATYALATVLVLSGIVVGCGAADLEAVPESASIERSHADAVSPLASPTAKSGPAEATSVLVSAYERLSRAESGFYEERIVLDGSVHMTTWVHYRPDLHDYRIGLPQDLKDPTAEDPTLRYIHQPGSILMWHPEAEAECGSPWVDMTDVTEGTLNDSFGTLFIPGPMPSVKVVEMLDGTIGQARKTGPEEFTIPVNALSALPGSVATVADKPEVIDLLDRDVQAAVWVEADRIEMIKIDFSSLFEELTGERASVVMYWDAIGEGEPPVAWDLPVPEEVADGDCLPTGLAA